MDAATLLHALVTAFAAFACGAIARAVAARPSAPHLQHARRMLLAWWSGAAISNAAASLALAGVGRAFWGQILILVFLAAGTLAAVAMLLHLLHVFDGGTFGGLATLATATIVTTMLLTLGFVGGALAVPGAPVVPSAGIERAMLSVTLVVHGIPILVALGFGGLALETASTVDTARLIRLAGGLLTWSAAGLLATSTALQGLEQAHLICLGLAVVGTALCATYYVPADMAFRRRAHSRA